MVFRFVVVGFVDWLGGVYDVGFDGLFVYDGLNLLVDMVVNVLATDGRLNGTSLLSLYTSGLIRKLCGLAGVEILGRLVVAMLEVAVLNVTSTVVMLLGESLLVVYWLYRGVEVILVDLLVERRVDALLLLLVDGLVGDSGIYGLVDRGVMMAILAGELLDCVLCGLHFGSWNELFDGNL